MRMLLKNAIAALCFAPAIFAASGPGPLNPQPRPVAQYQPADIKAAWATSDVRIGHNQDVLNALVTVTDAKTGMPVTNLSPLQFHVTFATVIGINPCAVPPAIKSFFSGIPGVYSMTIGFTDASCSGWFPGQFPVALEVVSVFNPLNPLSPGTYQGQLSTLVEIQ